MTKAGDSPCDELMRALSRAEKQIPADLQHLSLTEIKKRWQDPAERPRIEKAFAPLVKAALSASRVRHPRQCLHQTLFPLHCCHGSSHLGYG